MSYIALMQQYDDTHHMINTFEVACHINQSRFRRVKKWELWFEATYCTEGIDDGSGSSLLQIAQHGE